MEEIKIYHSFWRMLILFLACIAFVAGCFFMLEHTKDVLHIFVAWIGIVFFGLCGLYMLYAIIKERLTGKPFLKITDESIIREGVKQTIIHFADVESFEVVTMKNQQFVAVHYKPSVEQKKLDETNTLDRSVRNLNRKLVNAQENISTVGTGMKAEVLCDLLNERLGYFSQGSNP